MNRRSNQQVAECRSRREFLLSAASVPVTAFLAPTIRAKADSVASRREIDTWSLALRKQALDAWYELKLIDPLLTGCISRLDKEHTLIEKLGLAGDFLAACEIVRELNQSGLRVLGRQTEHASLVAYVLGIIHVNPIAVGLTYEHFEHHITSNRRVSLDVCSVCWERLRDGGPCGRGNIRLVSQDELTAISRVQNRVGQSQTSTETFPPAYNDTETYEMLSRGDTEGIPFLDQPESQRALTRLRPNCFEDLVAFAALEYGWFDTLALDRFVAAGHGRLRYGWPSYFAECLAPTYGQMLFHEQAFRIIQKLLFCDYGKAVQYWNQFVDPNDENHAVVRQSLQIAARRIGLDERKSADLLTLLSRVEPESCSLTVSVYGAFLDYQLAYLKAHYPVEFSEAWQQLRIEGIVG